MESDGRQTYKLAARMACVWELVFAQSLLVAASEVGRWHHPARPKIRRPSHFSASAAAATAAAEELRDATASCPAGLERILVVVILWHPIILAVAVRIHFNP